MNQLVLTKSNGTGKVLILVLEPGNIQRIREDRPVFVRVGDLFPEGIPRDLDVVIAFSETPVADARAFAQDAGMGFDERQAVAKAMRPHCPECRSTIEQYGVYRDDKTPVATVFCPQCGNVLGMLPRSIFDSVPAAIL